MLAKQGSSGFSLFKSKPKTVCDDNETALVSTLPLPLPLQSPSKDDSKAMKKKVAELQQRKKELQQKQKQQKETNKTSSSSISEDLKGIDLSSTNSETLIITVHVHVL